MLLQPQLSMFCGPEDSQAVGRMGIMIGLEERMMCACLCVCEVKCLVYDQSSIPFFTVQCTQPEGLLVCM